MFPSSSLLRIVKVNDFMEKLPLLNYWFLSFPEIMLFSGHILLWATLLMLQRCFDFVEWQCFFLERRYLFVVLCFDVNWFLDKLNLFAILIYFFEDEDDDVFVILVWFCDGCGWWRFKLCVLYGCPFTLCVLCVLEVLVGVMNRGKEIEYEECDVGEIVPAWVSFFLFYSQSLQNTYIVLCFYIMLFPIPFL